MKLKDKYIKQVEPPKNSADLLQSHRTPDVNATADLMGFQEPTPDVVQVKATPDSQWDGIFPRNLNLWWLDATPY